MTAPEAKDRASSVLPTRAPEPAGAQMGLLMDESSVGLWSMGKRASTVHGKTHARIGLAYLLVRMSMFLRYSSVGRKKKKPFLDTGSDFV